MNYLKLSTLTEAKRQKVLTKLKTQAMFELSNFNLKLKDWIEHYNLLQILKEYDFPCEDFINQLLNVSVSVRTGEEQETLETYKQKLRSFEGAKLKKTQDK